jgi:hypothetical protein
VYVLVMPVNALIRRISVWDASQRSRVKQASKWAWLGAVPVWALTYTGSLLLTASLTDIGSPTWPQAWALAVFMLILTWLFTGLRLSRGTPRPRQPLLLRFVRNPVTYQPVKYSTLHVPSNRMWAAAVAAVLCFQLLVFLTLPVMSPDAQVIAVGFAGIGGFFFAFGAVATAMDMDTRWGKAVGGLAAGSILALSVGAFFRV